jgi:hypothetical protein
MKNILLTLLAVVLSVSSLTAQSITTSGGVRLEEFDCSTYGILWYNRWREPIVKIAHADHCSYYGNQVEVCKFTVEDSKSYFIMEKTLIGSDLCSFVVSYYNEYGSREWTESFVDGNYEGCIRGGRNYN